MIGVTRTLRVGVDCTVELSQKYVELVFHVEPTIERGDTIELTRVHNERSQTVAWLKANGKPKAHENAWLVRALPIDSSRMLRPTSDGGRMPGHSDYTTVPYLAMPNEPEAIGEKDLVVITGAAEQRRQDMLDVDQELRERHPVASRLEMVRKAAKEQKLDIRAELRTVDKLSHKKHRKRALEALRRLERRLFR